VEDDLFAEVLVDLGLAAGDRQLPEPHLARGRADRDLVAIQVIVVGNVPAQPDQVSGRARRGEHERLVGLQEVGIGFRAAAAAAEQPLEVEALPGGRCGRRGGRLFTARRGGRLHRGGPRLADARRPARAHRPGLRRVAEPAVGTALQLHLEVEVARRAGERDRHAHLGHVAVDDLAAEEFVLVVHADRQ
jgi:hypothetical protein